MHHDRHLHRASSPLGHPRGHAPEFCIHLARRTAQNQRANGIASHLDVRKGAKDVNMRVRKHDARLCRILDSEFRFPILARDAADAPSKVLSFECLREGCNASFR